MLLGLPAVLLLRTDVHAMHRSQPGMNSVLSIDSMPCGPCPDCRPGMRGVWAPLKRVPAGQSGQVGQGPGGRPRVQHAAAAASKRPAPASVGAAVAVCR